MKRIFIILLVFMTCSQAVFSQTDINGVYADDSGQQVEISGNRIVLSSLQNNNSRKYLFFYQKEIYAEATYVWENDRFIRLRDIHDYPLTEIKYFEWKRKDSSDIKVSVILPDIEGREVDVKMSYFYKGVELIDSKKMYDNENRRATFFIPSDQNTINIEILPKQLHSLLLDESEYKYNSYIKYDTWVRFESDRAKDIEVAIPGIDDGYFGRYYVNGDYIRVDGDKLHWRGRVFKKSTIPENR